METFDYSAVPYGFIHCMNTACPQAKECLRYVVTQHIPADVKYVNALNPAFRYTPEAHCPYYKPIVTARYARGISHLYDELPHRAAIDIKQALIDHFSRSRYYRFNRKELHITPDEQAAIAHTFQRFGVTTEPRYDTFEEGYAW